MILVALEIGRVLVAIFERAALGRRVTPPPVQAQESRVVPTERLVRR